MKIRFSLVKHGIGLLVVLLILAAPGLLAEDLSIQGYLSIAPSSIPINIGGTAGIAMTRLQFRNGFNGDSDTSLSEVTVSLTSSGAIDETDITAVRIYLEPQGGSGQFDNGDAGGDDILIGGPATFSGGTATITLDYSTYDPSTAFGWGGSTHLFVVFDFADDTDTDIDVGCEITSVRYGNWTNPTFTESGNSPDSSMGTHGVHENLDYYEVALAASGLAPASADQTTEDVTVMQLDFDLATTVAQPAPEDASVTVDLDSIRLHSIGDADADVAVVILYADTNTNGSYDDGIDLEITTGTLSGGYVTLNPVTNLQIDASGITYFVCVDVAGSATIANTIGLEIEDPSTDIVFVDVIEDDNAVGADYAYVNLNYEYVQAGYVTSATATPTTNNSFSVTELMLPDTTPPTVLVTTPSNGGVIGALDDPIMIYFSEDVVGADTGDEANFTFLDSLSNPIAFSASYSNSGGTYVTTLTPDADLDYEEVYTVTVLGGVIDDTAAPPNTMAAAYPFTFVTGQQYPDFDEPIATNNRILPGSTDPVLIFIPEPPGGPQERVTVQIFTTTGRRVATLVNNRRYQDILSSLPLVWDGTNGRSQRLGPGLYFIQINTASYKRVLKAMIVR